MATPTENAEITRRVRYLVLIATILLDLRRKVYEAQTDSDDWNLTTEIGALSTEEITTINTALGMNLTTTSITNMLNTALAFEAWLTAGHDTNVKTFLAGVGR